MKRLLVFLFVLAILPMSGFSLTVEGVNIPDSYSFNGKDLVLNGTGLRKKFFVKVYVGALYLENRAKDVQSVMSMDSKAIKMHFLYKKVGAEKMREAFVEGFEDNGIKDIDRFRAFIELFNFDVVSSDELDLVIIGDALTVLYNGKNIGVFNDKMLAEAVLKVYFGDKPADNGLKEGMLGN
ncbi:chalcone isomerase family protein [Deferribacteraceae bacterium V6Fe1]|nr:chalcone isomerase family protein [Deferribacteraceae bacterium V6Fe1]